MSPKHIKVGSNPITLAKSKKEKIEEVLKALDREVDLEEMLYDLWRRVAIKPNVMYISKEVEKELRKKLEWKK